MVRRLLMFALYVAVCGCTSFDDGGSAACGAIPKLSDTTIQWGLPVFGGTCIALHDFNGDRYPDLLLSVSEMSEDGSAVTSSLRFYANEAGTAFREVLRYETLEELVVFGCTAGDYDRDGDLDVLVGGGPAGLRLLRNEGAMQFSDVSDALPMLPPEANGTFTLGFVDFNQDGWLDVVLGPHIGGILVSSTDDCVTTESDFFCGQDADYTYAKPLLIENKEGKFFVRSDVAFGGRGLNASQGVAARDVNEDGLVDLLFSNDFGSNALYLRDSDGGYSDRTEASGLDVFNHGMGLSFVDVEGDGQDEIYVADLGPDQLHQKVAGGTFVDVAKQAGVFGPSAYSSSWSPLALDIENDGDEDIFVACSAVGGNEEELLRLGVGFAFNPSVEPHDILLLNDGSRFARSLALVHERPHEPVPSFGSSAMADIDLDGDIDVLASSHYLGRLRLWENQSRSGNWLGLRLRPDQAAQLDGLVVELREGDTVLDRKVMHHATGALGSSSLDLHFGLCRKAAIETIRFSHPNGFLHAIDGPTFANQWLDVELPL